MNDREFIELLNLYVDHEISAEDALRLEAEVIADPKRREVYDQYCRMQKACAELSQQAAEPAGEPQLVEFPSTRTWRMGPMFGALAAAAAVAIVVGLREKGGSRPETVTFSNPASAGVAPVAQVSSDAMKPVFLIGRSPAGADTGRQGAVVLAPVDAASRYAQLNWIGDVHMTPVFSTTGKDFLLNPKTDLKAAAITDPQANHDDQEPAEMAAFRFQR